MKGKLVFIPGLGADARLFAHQRKAFKNSLTPQWIAPIPAESLADYAQRWSKILKLKPGCCLVGVSFGGMVVLEMAKWIKPRAVLLIASCRHPSSIPIVFRTLGAIPGRFVVGKAISKVLPSATGWFLGGETPGQKNLLLQMYLKTPTNFLNWTMSAIRGWSGYEGGNVLVRHIHGKNDHLIPCRRIRADEVIAGAGHLINLTHPKEVNDFIKKYSG